MNYNIDSNEKVDNSIINNNDKIPPLLRDWIPESDDLYFNYTDEVVKATFSKMLNGESFDLFETFIINKKHYKERMTDVTHHINYFIKYYDIDKSFFMDILATKYLIDTNNNMSTALFKDIIIKRIFNKVFISRVKQMAYNLHVVNINTDKEGKYKSTPKITNDHARLLLALSFAYRLILPLCIHFSNINTNIVQNRDYILCFGNIYMAILDKFEEDDIPIYIPLCNFVKYRLDRFFKADSLIWEKKKQLYGITYETVFQNLIHEVILVKSLYKISYDRSVVSYIDGVVSNSYNHFRFENFKFKPVEIEADTGGDNDDYLSHAESLEMSIYRIDESNQMINDINIKKVLKKIYNNFAFTITDEEYEFYYKKVKLNYLIQMLLHAFYSRFFKSSTAIYMINKKDTIKLLIILKKYLQAVGMQILPQICTAIVKGKFKENIIKNSKFIEKFETSSIYQNIIQTKFKYIKELSPKEDPIIKRLSTIINSNFELVDTSEEVNGMILENIPNDILIDEFLEFLSII